MTFAELIQCNLPSRMLRSEKARLKPQERERAQAWLEQNKWRYEVDRYYGPTYYDPVTGTDWGLNSATRIQMVRYVQPFLEARGWHCIGNRQRSWTYASDPIFKGEHWTKKSERKLLRALKEEGVQL